MAGRAPVPRGAAQGAGGVARRARCARRVAPRSSSGRRATATRCAPSSASPSASTSPPSGSRSRTTWRITGRAIRRRSQLFQMREGKVQSPARVRVRGARRRRAESFYDAVLPQYYVDAEPPPEIYLPRPAAATAALHRGVAPARRGAAGVLHACPVRGVKQRFLELVRKNASLAFEGRFRAPHVHGVEVLEALARGARPRRAARTGSSASTSRTSRAPTASPRWWSSRAGKPKKADYRIFTIRGVAGAGRLRVRCAEAVTRRYRAPASARTSACPDLVLIDGGTGQLAAAVRALAEVGLPMLPVISLAKRDEEIHLRGARRAGPARPRLAGAPPRPADPRRGAPLRRHAPPRGPQQADLPERADHAAGDRGAHRAPAARAVRVAGGGAGGERGGAGGGGRKGAGADGAGGAGGAASTAPAEGERGA